MTAALIIIIFLYMLSSAAYLGFFMMQNKILQPIAYSVLMGGFLLHTGLMGYQYVQIGQMPVQNLHQTLSFAAWALAGVYLLLRYRFHLKILGAYTAPLTTLMMIVAFCVPQTTETPSTILNSIWLIIHVAIIFIGEAALALAGGTGGLYLLQEHAIKTKNTRFFFKRLPSLEFLDSAGYMFIITGFTLLTVGLITGFIYAEKVWGKIWSWDPKEIWSVITWLIYAALLHERLVAGWRGRRAAIMAIIGFAALIFTFFGVNFFLEGHHNEFTRW
ncbi:MAG: c-type cytochrome biogenesis protein CcsB [Desulfobacterales bacterium]|nr:c-type cytochrome biogenesis protein CcsB [Desulfobacterales bacterium]